jgi:hypothetical protein
VRLALVLIGVAVAVGFAVAVAGVLLFASVAAGQGAPAAPLWILLGVVLVPVLIVGGIALSIVVLYAQRAIALDDVGALESLRVGWRTLRGHLGASLLAWVIGVGLGLAAGLALLVLFLVALALVGGVGVGVWTLVGAHPVTVAYAALGGLGMLVAGAAVVGLTNAFFWNYWTLAYMQLHGGSPRSGAAA